MTGIYVTAGRTAEHLARILAEIAAERAAQDAKWGEQNHLDGTGDQEHALRPLSRIAAYADLANATSGTLAYLARQACQANGSPDSPDTWTAILLEEVFEALAEDDPAALRRELVQVAAVAVEWVEGIDRRMQRTRAATQDDYPAAVSAVIEAGKGKCQRCLGSGKVAGGTEDLDPWPIWEALPPGSDLAVRLGMVTPEPCPACGGTGEQPAEP